jgi:class 3 adenylate cyclase
MRKRYFIAYGTHTVVDMPKACYTKKGITISFLVVEPVLDIASVVTMQQITDWLNSIGLGQYAQRFAENGIDLSVARDLTDHDLEKLGVLFGHRRKLLHSIDELKRTACAGESARRNEGERRQLTVMFCDLVGSTALSTRFDPEDMRELIGIYQAACADVIDKYDGFIARFLGDGILAYFGYPRAHEDDAERAVRAGLEIVTSVGRLETCAQEPLNVRIGIATGLVGFIGKDASKEQPVVGETPNLAARLQGVAEPGMVAVATSTRRLLGGLFRLRALGRQHVKGFVEPVAAWAVEGVAPLESRFEAVRAACSTGFVGRKEEMAFVLARQQLAWRGQGQVVLISGEPGIGKSRIAAAFGEKIASAPHRRLRYQCSPYHADSSLYPFIGQLERASGFGSEDLPGQKLDKLAAMLAIGIPQVVPVMPLFGALLSIPTGERYPPLRLSPAQQRRQTFTALLNQLEGLARQHPLLIVFEDMQWADASTLELLDLIVERIKELPILMLMTFRPEFEPPWTDQTNVSVLTLERLDREDAGAIVQQVTGGRPLPKDIMEQIIARTDGIPLFVEELTKTVLESGLVADEAEGYRLKGPLRPFAVPVTLQDSLMARLDRLAPVKEVAQIGAAIGRQFSYMLLRVVTGSDDVALTAALEQLEQAGLVFRYGTQDYRFKHALVQDAAYESLLKSQRQVLHKRIAETIRDQFPAIVKTEPEVIAHHFSQAKMSEAACEWWSQAGRQALQHSAFAEAIAHLRKAVTIADTLPLEPTSRMKRLHLQTAYSAALHGGLGYGAPETEAAWARARELATNIKGSVELLQIRFGLFVGTFVRGQLIAMRELAEAIMSATKDWPESPVAALVAHCTSGMTQWSRVITWAHDFILSAHSRSTAPSGIPRPLWLLGWTRRPLP